MERSGALGENPNKGTVSSDGVLKPLPATFRLVFVGFCCIFCREFSKLRVQNL